MSRKLNPVVPKKQNKTPVQELKPVQYERLGRLIESVFIHGYANRKRLLWMTFAKGIVNGVGSVIGATIVIGLLLWTLSLLGTVPFIGPIAESLQETINTNGSAE